MTISVRYYARLKEEARCSQETVDTQAATIDALWAEVSARHGFTLNADHIKAAQADEFCAWNSPLIPGALVVFMPPVAGG